jgi:hypothetical protein
VCEEDSHLSPRWVGKLMARRAARSLDRAHPYNDVRGEALAEMLDGVTYPANVDVCEHGIVVPDGEQPPAGLAIVATTRLPIYSEFSLMLVDRDGSSLNERAIHALDVPGPSHGRGLLRGE